ncbi:MAG: hypothetical protein P4L10_16725 [Acidobacteriaceae bacterium]|nr:hypothetical protein [Acidobacteriaceae bacterium]
MSASASYNSAQIAEARSQTRRFGHDNALPQGSAETFFSTLLSTLNCIKAWNLGKAFAVQQ